MKKVLIFMALMLAFIAISGQSITINSIGMHKDGDAGNFDVKPGDVVLVSVDYTTVDMMSMGSINFNGIDDKIGWIAYDGTSPSGTFYNFQQVAISNQSTGTTGTNQTVTFNFTVPTTEDRGSFQVLVGLKGYDNLFTIVNSSTYTSYLTVGSFDPPASTASGDFQSYMGNFYDTATDAPTLYTPDHLTNATYDNSTLSIDFELSEAPLAGSVKLYFSPNSNGSSPSTTLTLASILENTSRHLVEFTATGFLTSSPNITAVSGTTSLTHLNTYYVAIGYQDALGNTEAKSPWNKLIYDNVAIQPTAVSGIDNSGANFKVNFTLGEASQTDGITIYIKNSVTETDISTIEMGGSYASGNHVVTLDGSNLANSTNVLSVSGSNSINSGDFYKLAVKMVDLAGNSNTSYTTENAFQYLNNNISVTATTYTVGENCALLGYNLGADQAVGYVGLKTSSGAASLTSMAFDVGGSIDAGDATDLTLYESTTNNFAGGTPISQEATFTGTGTYTFAIANKVISTTEKYYFLAISLTGTELTYDDNINLSISASDITVSGSLTDFTATNFAQKCLYRAIIANHYATFPSIAPGSANAPFFRLDLTTNQGTSIVQGIKLALSGTLTSNDVIVFEGFKIWESTSTTFSTGTATQRGAANYNSTIQFSGLSSVISTTPKYYYFTVTTKSTANTEAVIGGDIILASDITTPAGTTVNAPIGSSFPLNGTQQTLPVELSSFTSLVINGNSVKIDWTVETETGLSGYYLLKGNSSNLDSATQIPVLIPSINTSQTHTYSFVDREVEIDNVYYYWLKTVELSNESETFGPTMVTVGNPISDTPEVILGTRLYENYPNPFNPSTNISFSLATPQKVSIKIYNVRGQLVKDLFDNYVSQINTKHNLVWNGMDNQNNNVVSGIYYSKMIAGKHTEFKKMLLMK